MIFTARFGALAKRRDLDSVAQTVQTREAQVKRLDGNSHDHRQDQKAA